MDAAGEDATVLAGGRDPGSDRVEARIVGAGTELERMPWTRAAHGVALEELASVRTFPVQRGRRIAPGWWWSASTGRLVHYGFGAMRTQIMLLDHDPQVVALACSPVELAWLGEDETVAVHAPHLMARLRDGSGLLVDCAGGEGVPARLADHAAAMAAAARAVGWHYRIARPPDPVLAANVRWLSGYRHPRHSGSTPTGRVAGLFAQPLPLIEGVRRLGEPIAAWPVVFHALWSGVLSAPLDQPLHERTVATTTATGAAG
ncbi:TnsA-like heteromeric transposase endonuclease subunit [Streptomyces sp. BE303]|uniref:TnsA-like heteromeric transposase endonuclease subunit n=1 Tax=Streptomyces sp. BE303 TaxID=3002528 RepID=UPI002E76DF88|nr:TnsA-like heteromeric transposase endonuclease subunit [Streptomyces sp. BE303]MED7952988.1 TnsA-like heteromeric transposase endonuclease subunit [Streptomyces sp. BE303]